MNSLINKKYIKHWKNQYPSSKINENYKLPNKKEIDIFFPPTNESIGYEKSNSLDLSQIEWKHITDLLSSPVLFENKIEPADIMQVSLGNCYFLSAIAALTENPSFIESLFLTKDVNQNGFFEILMFIDKEWKIVFVDCYFPIIKGTKTFIYSKPNKNELWLILLEKAWAKVNGSYENTIGGWPSDPFICFTGCSCEKIRVDSIRSNIEFFKEKLLFSDQSNFMMCASTSKERLNLNSKSHEECGLVRSHAYTLINTYNIKKDFILKIRNPWGCKEWNGDWSDSSSLWTKEITKILLKESKEDGIFYISINDFINYFDIINICHVNSFFNDQTYRINIRKDMYHPQVFGILVNEKGFLSIGVYIKHWRYNRKLNLKSFPISIVLIERNTLNVISTGYGKKFPPGFGCEMNKGEYLLVVTTYVESENIVDIVEYIDETDNNENDEYALLKVSFSNSFLFEYISYNRDLSYKLLENIIHTEIKNNNETLLSEDQNPIFTKTENTFHLSGLAFKYIKNTSFDKELTYEISSLDTENIKLLDKYEFDINKKIVLYPNEYKIILGIRNEDYGKFYFNLKSSFKLNPILSKNRKDEAAIESTFPFLKFNYEFSLKSEFSPFQYTTSYLNCLVNRCISELSKVNKNNENLISNSYSVYKYFTSNHKSKFIKFLIYHLPSNDILYSNKFSIDVVAKKRGSFIYYSHRSFPIYGLMVDNSNKNIKYGYFNSMEMIYGVVRE